MIEEKLKLQSNIFERHPQVTLGVFIVFFLASLYGLCSVKFLNNAMTEFEPRSIKQVVLQSYYAKIIDANVGRFIKLREHRPDTVRLERPTKNYMSQVAPTLERQYYKIAIDKNGFIEPSEVHASPDISIVFLGGSTTECLYVDELQRFPYLVGRNLEARLDKKINSYNSGVSANDSLHSINILVNKIIPMKPDYIIMMHNINDLVMLRSQGTYWYANSLKSPIQTAQNIFTRFEFPPVKHQATVEDYQQAFEKNLRTFMAIARIHGSTPVLMTQANRVDDDDLYQVFNQRIRDIGQAENIVVIDLASQIPRETKYLYDHYHYTEAGSILAAHIISEKLIALAGGGLLHDTNSRR